jgi:hypothetical protein
VPTLDCPETPIPVAAEDDPITPIPPVLLLLPLNALLIFDETPCIAPLVFVILKAVPASFTV